MKDTDLKQKLWDELAALPKPVTRDDVLKAAALLPAKESGEFTKWFDRHEAYLLGRLNA